MIVECTCCGRRFRKKEDEEEQVMEDVCPKCERDLREDDFYNEY